MPNSSFFELIQKSCLPGIWSKGVALSRSAKIIQDAKGEDEIILRIKTPDHPVSWKVTLWPEDEDWFCDCQDKNSVCPHVAASVIALRSGILSHLDSAQLKTTDTPRLYYRFDEINETLKLTRWIRSSESNQIPVTESLVSIVGGISSGRIKLPALPVTQDDFAVDGLLSASRPETLPWIGLFKILSNCPEVYFQEHPITVSPHPLSFQVLILDDEDGFRLRIHHSESITQAFRNGVALCSGVLKAVQIPALSPAEQKLISGEGTFYPRHSVNLLVTQILPSLQTKLEVTILSKRLPIAKRVPPKIRLKLDSLNQGQVLSVYPEIIYEDASTPSAKVIFIPNQPAELELAKKLRQELQIGLGQATFFEGELAIDFIKRSKGWNICGDGLKSFEVTNCLAPSIELSEKNLFLSIQSQEKKENLDPSILLKAWRENRSYIQLLSGRWLKLPKDWLDQFGERIESLLRAKSTNKELPRFLLPQAIDLCEDSGQACPEALKTFRKQLYSIKEIPDTPLPPDLSATLRPYQREGVNWLGFLRSSEVGAILADDMGLGKTLQTLCVIEGKTLIICPTSVLPNWKNQIFQFRPKLSVCVYHGSQRFLDPQADVILTSYSILRMDIALLTQIKWSTIVLDEAQVIKNPESQIAKAAYQLEGSFKLSLSGTPIENQLSDLWSQFHFINPGLLGTYQQFNETYSQSIQNGQSERTQQLQKLIQPFILRRLKQDVAKDLPLKTESVLYCELDTEEREIYSSLLASSRHDILEKLNLYGSTTLQALEMILRLRQACCHPRLIPGQMTHRASSSKLDLLLDALKKSIEHGHRALVFSQWTSYLDLITPLLTVNSITWGRLDGTTSNRNKVIEDFQHPAGPSVLLISLKAGGMGLNLTAADHVFILDPWWNPAVENQATDRTHRIGQTQPVFVYRLIAQNTIEERVLLLQKEKSNLSGRILENSFDLGSLSRQELTALLTD